MNPQSLTRQMESISILQEITISKINIEKMTRSLID